MNEEEIKSSSWPQKTPFAIEEFWLAGDPYLTTPE
jgi:hypothetical protein